MADLDTENPAPWYTSRSIWGAVVGGIAAAANMAGHAIAPDLLGPMIDLFLNIATVVGSIIAVEGRVTATKTISR